MTDVLVSLLESLSSALTGKFSARITFGDGVDLRVEWRYQNEDEKPALIATSHRFKDREDYEERLLVVGENIIKDFAHYQGALR